MSFEGPDPEYLDGELLERNLGDDSHSATQVRLTILFGKWLDRVPFQIRTELHMKLTPQRIRIADLAVFLEKPSERIPSSPPFIAIEIVSPSDRYVEIRDKLEEYRTWGIKHIWLVDPASRNFSVYDEAGLREVPTLAIPKFDFSIEKSDVFE